jgi:cell division protein FtsQ
MPRKRRIVVAALAATVLGVAGTAPLWGPDLGRKVEWLEVRRVEVSGTRLLPPHEVLAAAGFGAGHHLLDELATHEAALLAHPVIQDVSIRRRFPHTLRVRVTEKRPVALVASPTLALATAGGEILPLAPTDVPMDLPLVRGTLDDSASAVSTRRVLAEVERLTALAPAFMMEISEIRLVTADAVLHLLHPRADILLPLGASLERVEEMRRVLADVDRRLATGEAGARRTRTQIDLRYDEQVVVRPSPTREFS